MLNIFNKPCFFTNFPPQELEEERNKLREQLAEMSQRVESLDHDNVSSLAAK